MTAQDKTVEDGELLVSAMTRPFTVGGFTLQAIAITVLLPMIVAAVMRSFWPFLLMPILFAACFWVCAEDVYLFDVVAAMGSLKACPNRSLWGCRRYAPR